MKTVLDRLLSGCLAISIVGLLIQGTKTFFEDSCTGYLYLGINTALAICLSFPIYNATYKNPTP